MNENPDYIEEQNTSVEKLDPTNNQFTPENKDKLIDEKNKTKLDQTKVILDNFSSRVDKAKSNWNELIMLYVVLERYQKEVQEITQKSNPRTLDIIKLGESLDKKCDALKWEIMSDSHMDKEKLNEMLSQSFWNMDNKDFLKQFSKDQRLEKITKPPKESKDVKSWEDIRFTFTFENKLNENLYLKTTAWQVLPSEVKEVVSRWKKYFRQGLEWEFFTNNNERLIIHEDTVVSIWDLRNKVNIPRWEKWQNYEDDKESIEYITDKNKKTISEYLKNNPNDNSNIVEEAVNRGVDPKFAVSVFSDLIKWKEDIKEINVILEDAFTEFDRSRGKVEASLNMEGEKNWKTWKYDENLTVNLLKTLFPSFWREKAISSWFSNEELTNFENISNTKIDFSTIGWETSEMIDEAWEHLWVNKKLIQSILMQESSWNMAATRFEKHVYDRELKKWTPPETAKLLATSFWGFQIMWFNYKTCWYSSVQDFVEAMKKPENQFNAFATFIKSKDSLYFAMKKEPPDFASIAHYYNGPWYAKNRYDKMIEKRFYA